MGVLCHCVDSEANRQLYYGMPFVVVSDRVLATKTFRKSFALQGTRCWLGAGGSCGQNYGYFQWEKRPFYRRNNDTFLTTGAGLLTILLSPYERYVAPVRGTRRYETQFEPPPKLAL